MADEFDRFLASSLAPHDRAPDRRFVGRVQARIIVEDRLARERGALVRNLVGQTIALFAVAGALWLFGRAAPVAAWFAQSGDVGTAIMVAAFTLLVVVLGRPGRGLNGILRPLNKLNGG